MKYQYKKYLAKKFRKVSTRSEAILWNKIRNRQYLNLKFRRQYVVYNFVIDFYCFEYRLAIEIDGGIHQKQIIQDKTRQKIIETKKINFLRFTNREIESNINKVLVKINNYLQRTEYPSPVTGEGRRGEDRIRGGEDG